MSLFISSLLLQGVPRDHALSPLPPAQGFVVVVKAPVFSRFQRFCSTCARCVWCLGVMARFATRRVLLGNGCRLYVRFAANETVGFDLGARGGAHRHAPWWHYSPARDDGTDWEGKGSSEAHLPRGMVGRGGRHGGGDDIRHTELRVLVCGAVAVGQGPLEHLFHATGAR